MLAELPAGVDSWIAALQNCRLEKNLQRAKLLHAQLHTQGLDLHPVLANHLVPTLVDCGTVVDARLAFVRLSLHHHNHHSWNSLISGYIKSGELHLAFHIFHHMQQYGSVQPSSITYLGLLTACGRLKEANAGHRLHAEIIQRGFESVDRIGNSLVDVYSKYGALAEANKVFDGLPVQDTVSWNALMSGYTEHGAVEKVVFFQNKMLIDGVAPDYVTFICSLKACAAIGDLETGLQLHSETTKKGLEKHLYVSSILVGFYCECSLLVEARQVVDGLPVQDTVLWNALIAGYAEHGLVDEVRNFRQQMLHKGLSPDSITFVHGLKACATIKDVKAGREFHTEIVQRSLESEICVGSTLVDMYIECCLLEEACKVFDKLLVRDVIAWTALILGYAECGASEKVRNCFQRMMMEGLSPNSTTFLCSLKAIGLKQDLDQVWEIHAEAVKRGFEEEHDLCNMLVDTYGKCGSLAEACQVFEGQSVRSAVLWNTLIGVHAEHGLAGPFFLKMLLEGVSPNCITFICYLKSCDNVQDLPTGRTLHSEIIKRGLERDLHVGSSLVDMYSKCCSLIDTCKVFVGLAARSTVSWNAMISGYIECGSGIEAGNCMREMLLEGILPDSGTFSCCVKACASIKDIERGRALHAEITKRGFERELHGGSALVDMYIECGFLTEALQVFDGMPFRDSVSWNALIAGYAEHGQGEVVEKFFHQMVLEGTNPDCVTFIYSLKASGIIQASEVGKELHIELTKRGFERNLFVGNTLVDMYGKCGLIIEASQVFKKLLVQHDKSWTSMIKAFGKNHEGDMAVRCFEDMLAQGVKPCSATFLCLLAACSHSSMVLKGQDYFKLMRELEVEPTLDHYACVVDLFARSGHLVEAESFVAAIQSPPSSILLYALLSACKNYGIVDMGHRCFQQLVETNEEGSAAFSLMADIYANAGRWLDAARLEGLRYSSGAKKKPGSALIEVNRNSYEFLVGSHKEEDLILLLEALRSRMTVEGLVCQL